MWKIETYNQFIEKLKSIGLTLDDLHLHGTMKKTHVRNFKRCFKDKKDSKEEWAEFKKDSCNYYCIVIMNPDIAKGNKSRGIT